MNKVILVGRVTKDIELRKAGESKVANFFLAVDDSYTGEADFINCVAWNGSAEFLSKYITKGKPIMIEGRIKTHSYEDKDGNSRFITEVVVERCEFCPFNSSEEKPKEEKKRYGRK